jgi:hypothetical protein
MKEYLVVGFSSVRASGIWTREQQQSLFVFFQSFLFFSLNTLSLHLTRIMVTYRGSLMF